MIRRALDIEKILHWAYRDELPKTGPAPTSPWDRMLSVGALGTLVDDGSGPEPGMPPVLGTPHPDALVVEERVRALSQVTEVEYDASVGLMPDMGFDLSEEEAIRRAMAGIVATVRLHARMGTRPPLTPAPQRCLPALHPQSNRPMVLRLENHWETTRWTQVLNDQGRVIEEYPALEYATPHVVPSPAMRGGIYKPGSYCPLRYDPEPRVVLMDRAEYLVWWAALDYLAADLNGRLQSIEVLPPVAAQQPWIDKWDSVERPWPCRHIRSKRIRSSS